LPNPTEVFAAMTVVEVSADYHVCTLTVGHDDHRPLMEAQMKAIFAALASAALLATPMASISTPAAAQPHGGGFRGGGGFHAAGGGVRGGGGLRGRESPSGEFHWGQHRDRDDGVGPIFGLPFDDPYYYDDPYGYDVGSYDGASPACGSWSWDDARGRYEWIAC
jgi:hypothetical protein